MKKLYINLLNFDDDKLAGVGYFFKRLISNINVDNQLNFDEIIFFTDEKIDAVKVFEIKVTSKIKFIKISFLKNPFIRILFEQLLLPFYFLNKGNLVIYSPTPSLPFLAKMFKRNIVLISTIHDIIPFKIKNKYSFFRTIYVKLLTRISAWASNKILTVSEFSKNEIVETLKVNSNKIEVIYNFIPEMSFENNQLSDSYFVTVSTIEPGKNIENMILGFNDFIKNNLELSHYKYYIIGKFGWNFKSIFNLVESLKLNDKVVFTGYLLDKEKNFLVKNSTGMIYLSKHEGFGIPPLEAMYFNKVSVVSNNSSLPEVVGNAGIIQHPDDINVLSQNLKKLIHNSDSFRNNIKYQIIKFDPSKQISKFVNILNGSISC